MRSECGPDFGWWCERWRLTDCGLQALTWGFRVGAGEGNRTLMTSLEGVPQRNCTTSDLGNVLAVRGHEIPLLTLANGTLMAR